MDEQDYRYFYQELHAFTNPADSAQDLSCELAVAVLTGEQAKYKTLFRNGEYIPFRDSELLPGQEFPGQVLFDNDSNDGSTDQDFWHSKCQLRRLGLRCQDPCLDCDPRYPPQTNSPKSF